MNINSYMVRPQRIRNIFFQPNATYFKPAGIPMVNLKEIVLSFDEVEAMRLVDFEEMEQNAAGKKMKISQSTLSRLLKSGRKKLTDAIVNGQAIKIQGGNFKMVRPAGGRYRALSSGGRGRRGGVIAGGPGGTCICPKCKTKVQHAIGIPCTQQICPKCGSNMMRA